MSDVVKSISSHGFMEVSDRKKSFNGIAGKDSIKRVILIITQLILSYTILSKTQFSP